MYSQSLIDKLKSAKKVLFVMEGYAFTLEQINQKKLEIWKESQRGSDGFCLASNILMIGTIILDFAFALLAGFELFVPGLIISIISFILIVIIESLRAPSEADSLEYYNSHVQELLADEEKCIQMASEYSNSSEFISATSLIPQEYFDSDSISYFIGVITNRRADTLKEAINLYENFLHQKRLEQLQMEQLAAAKENNQLMRDQLANGEQQIQLAREQLLSSMQLERNVMATKKSIQMNTFITLLKK